MSDDNSPTAEPKTAKPKTTKRLGATVGRQTAASHARHKGDEAPAEGVTAIATMLRTAAAAIEANPALARALRDGVAGAGAQIEPAPQAPPRSSARRSRTPAQPSTDGTSGTDPLESRRVLDPFAILREQGQAGLRARLLLLDLEALRTIVRSHRLDPGRVAARWTVRERLVELIVEQVQARAGLGRAFERV